MTTSFQLPSSNRTAAWGTATLLDDVRVPIATVVTLPATVRDAASLQVVPAGKMLLESNCMPAGRSTTGPGPDGEATERGGAADGPPDGPLLEMGALEMAGGTGAGEHAARVSTSTRVPAMASRHRPANDRVLTMRWIISLIPDSYPRSALGTSSLRPAG